MTNIKKALFMVAIGLVTATAVTVVATKESSILENTFAGGTTIDGNNRTTTFDSTNQLSLDENSRWTATAGNIGAYAPNGGTLDSGFGIAGDLILYCQGAGLSPSNKYYGFDGANIQSITIIVNTNNNAMSFGLKWAQLKNTFSKGNPMGSTLTKEAAASNENQTIVFTRSEEGSILPNPVDTYPCIMIYNTSGVTAKFVSVEISYTCK